MDPEEADCGELQSFLAFDRKNPKQKWKWQPQWEKCPICNQEHFLIRCRVWNEEMPYDQRVKLIRDTGRCKRCLSPKHQIDKCPRTKDTCRICNSDQHHHRLHPYEEASTNLSHIWAQMSLKDEDPTCMKQAAARYCSLKFQVVRLRNPVNGDAVLVNALPTPRGGVPNFAPWGEGRR